jgi:hypothetical protein
MTDINVLLEGERRGLLSPEKQAILAEARRRGLAKAPSAPIPAPTMGPQKADPWERTAQRARAVGQGATFGYGDELTALAGEAVGAGDYEDLLASEREKIAAFRESDPYIAGGGELLGGLSTLAVTGPATAAAKGAPYIGKAVETASRLPGWLKAVFAGSAYGGLYGSGTAEGGLEERLEGAQEGAMIGAGAAGIGYPLVRGAAMGGSKLLESARARWGNPTNSALAKYYQALLRDETSPQKQKALLASLGPRAGLVDAGGSNVRGLARHTANVPGPAQNRGQQFVTQRSRGEAARLTEGLKGLSPDEFYPMEEAFLNNLRTRSTPYYRKAFEEYPVVTSPALQKTLKSRSAKKALRAALDANDELTPDEGHIPGLRDMAKRGELSLEAWDFIKQRGFDLLLGKDVYRNKLTGRLNPEGKHIDTIRRRLVNELDDATRATQFRGATVQRVESPYKTARKIYGGDAEALGALRDGRNFLTKDPEKITKELADLSESGREAYRTGAARALKGKFSAKKERASIAVEFSERADHQSRLQAVFPNADEFREFRRLLNAETRFGDTRNYVRGGSTTATRLGEGQDALQRVGHVGGVIAAEKVPLGHQLVRATIFGKIGRALMGNPKAHDLEMAKILFNQDPAANQQVLNTLLRKEVWAALPATAKKQIGRLLLLAPAQQAGHMREGTERAADYVLGEE